MANRWSPADVGTANVPSLCDHSTGMVQVGSPMFLPPLLRASRLTWITSNPVGT